MHMIPLFHNLLNIFIQAINAIFSLCVRVLQRFSMLNFKAIVLDLWSYIWPLICKQLCLGGLEELH